MALIDKILGRKVIEVTRNVNGSFKVSIPRGYGWDKSPEMESMKECLNELAVKSEYRGKYRIRYRIE